MIQNFIDKELQQYICNKCQKVFYIPKKHTEPDGAFFLKDNFGCPYCNYNTYPNVGIFLREFTILGMESGRTINFLNLKQREHYKKEQKEEDEKEEE